VTQSVPSARRHFFRRLRPLAQWVELVAPFLSVDLAWRKTLASEQTWKPTRSPHGSVGSGRACAERGAARFFRRGAYFDLHDRAAAIASANWQYFSHLRLYCGAVPFLFQISISDFNLFALQSRAVGFARPAATFIHSAADHVGVDDSE